jgi:hypothetical protein
MVVVSLSFLNATRSVSRGSAWESVDGQYWDQRANIFDTVLKTLHYHPHHLKSPIFWRLTLHSGYDGYNESLAS